MRNTRTILRTLQAVFSIASLLFGFVSFTALRWMNPDMTIPRLWLTYPLEASIFAGTAIIGSLCLIVFFATME